MLKLLFLILAALVFSAENDTPDTADTADTPDTADTADTADTPDTPDAGTPATPSTAASAPGAPQFIPFSINNLQAFGSIQNLIELQGESDGNGAMISQPLQPGQYIVNLPGQDFPTIMGPGAPTVMTLDEFDYPVKFQNGKASFVLKPEHDNGMADVVDGRMMQPVMNVNGQIPSVPGLGQMPWFLQDNAEDLYQFNGFGQFDLGDLFAMQAGGGQQQAMTGVNTNSKTAQDFSNLLFMNGGENPLSDGDLQYHPSSRAFIQNDLPGQFQFRKIEDTVFGESDAFFRAPNGKLILNPDNFSGLQLQKTHTIQKSSSQRVVDDPFFWGFIASLVVIISGLGVACVRRKQTTLDDVLMETSYSSHV